ncbi:hypothetical protein GFL92_29495 [Rhizobium leguminosarum bv. viciae]|nr:hypothetical protein [Rhizobium leguminosarum bv. viciae]TBA89110.1 hypothetical protein ELH54_04350 [Rhizobium ruizarguesonis]TCA63232.1 hypothetical protein E0H62_35000 [Rhizobium leguminosarum bv. viciae]TCB12918.1 hypothetical protein E0J18_23845 [Rhizobium leguminosarum bv. viciae]TCB38453.1 hypothetical protein E0J02_27355 [Rhizobium leguminosarum bv. viciae]
MVRLILRSCKADRPHPDSIAEAILWATASLLAVLQLGTTRAGTTRAGLAWMPIAGFSLSIAATMIGKRQESTAIP